MADIRPFKGLRYRLDSPEQLGALVSPPYDMLDAVAIDKLYSAHPYNVIRIIQNRREPTDAANRDRHLRAGRLMEQWIRDGVLVRDSEDSLYIYRQRFDHDAGGGGRVSCERIGMTALVRLVDFSEGVVFPHEHTLSGPKIDRYELMEATKANTELIFGLVSDDGTLYRRIRECVNGNALGRFTDMRGVEHELYRTIDAARIEHLRSMLERRTILIADGHHRYETALTYARDTGAAGAAYVMMTMVSMADPGLVIRPFHRVVKKCPLSNKFRSARDLARYFNLSDCGEASMRQVHDFMSGRLAFKMLFVDAANRRAWGLTINAEGGRYIAEHGGGMSPQWNALAVSEINRLCVEAIMEQPADGTVLHEVFEYMDNAEAALARTQESGCTGCFFIRPLSIASIKEVVSAGERMPQKSTNFFPKLFSGLVFNTLDGR